MATQFVNKHITRVLAAGGTVADATRLAAADSWMTSEGLLQHIGDWSNPAFGVIKNGSNEISKIMGLGTTWLPRLGDLTPSTPANTLYDATAIGGLPAWTNTANTAYSYYGAARSGTIRTMPIRRKHHDGLTIVAVYKKSGTAVASMLGLGAFGGIYLQNTSGSPGSCKFNIGIPSSVGTAFSDTHPTTLANSAVHIIGGTFDQDTVTSYVEGVAGSGSSGYIAANANSTRREYRPLSGPMDENSQIYSFLASGTSAARFTNSTTATAVTPSGTANEALFSMSDLIFFYTALTPTQMASLNSLLRGWYGP